MVSATSHILPSSMEAVDDVDVRKGGQQRKKQLTRAVCPLTCEALWVTVSPTRTDTSSTRFAKITVETSKSH